MDDDLEGEDKQWRCGKAGSVNLQRVSSIVRDIGEPCLHQSPRKRSKMLKPDKWRATFDSDGKVFGFQKVLKLIVLGGVDPSIRAEVWEFLLGCYALGSTTEYRRQLRMARRERYMDLIKQCQKMHSSIGTGSLAYVVGSKLMDVRKLSKDNGKSEAEIPSGTASHDANFEAETFYEWNNNISTDASPANHRASSSDSEDLVTVRGSTDSAAYNSPHAQSSSDTYNYFSPKAGIEAHATQHLGGSCFDFPYLPVTNLFERNEKDKKDYGDHDDRVSTESKHSVVHGNMHSFQINNNVDLIMELNGSSSDDVSHASKSDTKVFDSDDHEQLTQSRKLEYKTKLNRPRISDIPETAMVNATMSEIEAVSEDRVSEWLWTLHRIVVDVVRTDSHLEFYEDAKNMARMSDILAVYAWVDPGTGYCQGMSDLLSPFVVLYEDNADAFWCFEMLLRRMRENFQMEGPTGVMKQLEALWRILELTDRETFSHLSLIGAESLHFAFRMLLVLFRRELSFTEALCMWEMMWAADFHESMIRALEEHCLQPLVLQLPRDSGSETGEESVESNGSTTGRHSHSKNGIVERPVSDSNGMKSASTHQTHPFCGLTRNFWSRNDRLQNCTVVTSTVTSTRNGDDDIPVYCVAAILITNRHKIIKETHSIDDMIKIFNDNLLNINIKRCIRTAIKLRKKYFYKIIRHKRTSISEV